MKSFRIIAVLATTLFMTFACAIPANAIGIFGQWQDSKDTDSGYGLGLKHNFSIIPIISVEARASWLRYSADNTDASLDLFPLEAFCRAKFSMFYGGLGVGYYIFSGDYSPENSVGGFAALGIEFTIAGLGAFGELRYLYLEPDHELGGSVDMSGIGANIGVSLPF